MAVPTLKDACAEMAKEALSGTRDYSRDVAETLANRFYEVAEEHQDFVRQQRETDASIALSIMYLAHVHAMTIGTDVERFRLALETLMELAVPNTGLTSESAAVLPHLQEGIHERLVDLPVEKESIRMEQGDAKSVNHMIDAAQEYGVVSDLLSLIEALFHGQMLSPEDRKLMYLASVAHPLAMERRGGN